MNDIKCFLHLADTHLSFGITEGNHYSSKEDIEKIYEYASKLYEAPSFAIITGDFVHEGNENDYQKAKVFLTEMYDKYSIKTYIALGNHDNHVEFNKAFNGSNQDESRYYYSTIIDGLRLIVLDSSNDETIYGDLDATQLDWLKQELEKPCELDTIIAMHHPPCGTSIMVNNHNNLRNNEKFTDLIKLHPVKAILVGHKHFATSAMIGTTPVYVGAGCSFGIQMPKDNVFEFIKSTNLQYCIIYDDQLFWSPLNLDSKHLIGRMSLDEMTNYKKK